ncbi:hypothetical protein B6S59_26060 [Pseudomonas sp. A46]|nr:DUF4124 domain-containing protein [Pseudomonas sp. A46]OWJ90953.1 hypothetical protein B6S59_26060 [Pseudomonas sp. A46]
MKRLSILALATLPCWPGPPPQAASVYRCIAEDGHLSFNQHGCPADSQGEEQQTRTPNLVSSEPLQREVSDERFPIMDWESPEPSRDVVVVGEREIICGGLISPRERRQAIIRKQVRQGMTRTDVESALGKPDRISGRNGQVNYHYKPKKGASQLVSFDEEGCVKGRH